jgi:hypothetical protein
MDTMYAGDLDNADSIDREQWKSRSILERIEEGFARIMQPML